MDVAKLNEHLFSDVTRLYAVLDGASVPDLPMRLYEMRPPNYCLFPGELSPDVAYTAPYVVNLVPNSPFTKWILSESFGNHWGIFAHCRFSIKEMRRHFRALVNVCDEQGNPMIFRFYDPRVLRQFLPTCKATELKSIFGNVQTFFAEAEDNENLLGFQLENDSLKESKLNLES